MIPAVAIIVPCYNAASTLAAAVESALVEDVVSEVIVIDDGSSDCSLAIARGFEPRIRVISGPNRGASAARNAGIAATTAEWIVFLDADDLLEPGTMGKRLAIAKTTNADVVICEWMEFNDDGAEHSTPGVPRSIDWTALEANAELATAVHIWTTTAAILYRRSIVEKIGGFRQDLAIIQDARLIFDAAYHGAKFAHAPHVGAKYRIAANSLSRRNPAHFYRDILRNGQQIETLWRAKAPLSPECQQALFGIYNSAARGLFTQADSQYFDAVAAQRNVSAKPSRHSRVATPLARLFGLRTARNVLSLIHRA